VARSLEQDVRALGAIASRAGVFCDFDGSLAPIVDDPQKARPLRGTSRVLGRLAKRYAVVAVVSGRPVSFLAKRLRSSRVQLVGIYGIEERVGRSLRVLPEVKAARSAVNEAAEKLQTALGEEPGVYVEHKGLAVSAHFRRARDKQDAMARATPVVDEIARAEGLRVTRGRLVIELAPPVDVDKGDVVRRVVADKGLGGAIVIGDDLGDLPTFAAVDDLELGVRVAVGSIESPPALIEAADHVVESPAAVLDLLKRLVDASRP